MNELLPIDIDMLVEPACLIRCFVAHPPSGFHAATSAAGLPWFATRFDLLTTVDPRLRRRLAQLPLYCHWQRWLCWPVTFIGTTVSEYAVLPTDRPAGPLIAQLLAELGARTPLLILKDLPCRSPLLNEHANAYAEEVKRACRAAGFTVVAGQALAYVPLTFRTLGEYLAARSPSRRKDLRRKLRGRGDLNIAAVPTGNRLFTDDAVCAELYGLYLSVYAQSTSQFDLLTPQFFHTVLSDANSGGMVFTYHHRGELVGFNLCFVHDDKLIDKYIGLKYPKARELNLYVVSWMHNLEFALTQGLRYYVAGWTDPQVKRELGASFTWTEHAVYSRSTLLRLGLRGLRRHFESDAQWQRESGRATSVGS